MGCRRDMWVKHFSPLYLSGLGLAHPDLVPHHVHALVSRGDKPGLREPALAHGEHERRVSEVGHAAVAVEVGDEFLGRYSHELGVEAGLGGEVGIVRRRSSMGSTLNFSSSMWVRHFSPKNNYKKIRDSL